MNLIYSAINLPLRLILRALNYTYYIIFTDYILVALAGGVTTQKCLDYVKEARERGLKAPVILMGYYNPIHQYGEEKFVKAAKEAGT